MQENYDDQSTAPLHPESQGISSAALLTFVNAIERIPEMHSLMLLRHGCVVAEGWWAPYAPDRPHMLFSLSKSFTSTAVGLAVSEGRLSVDDLLLTFFPDEAPPGVLDANLAKMRIRHLLSMSTGHEKDTTERLRANPNGDWIRAFLALPVEHIPGTHFVYNSGASYMLAAVVQKLTGMKLVDYLKPRLFEPLGIESPAWETSPQGINYGGWGLKIKTEDIARFGQLYLQKGMWEGRRLLSEQWVEEATSQQVVNGTKPDSDWEQGYGYQFWRCKYDAYRGDGAFGQYCVVLPAQDAVLAITSAVDDMQSVLDVVWKSLLPALSQAVSPDGLSASTSAQVELGQKLSGLVLLPPQGTGVTPHAVDISGKTFLLEPGSLKKEVSVLRDTDLVLWGTEVPVLWGTDAISFDFTSSASTIKLHSQAGEQVISVGCGEWIEGVIGAGGPDARPVAASGVWTTGNTFVLTLRYYETPVYDTHTFQFDGDRLLLKGNVNVGFGPKDYPAAQGRLSASHAFM